MRGEHPDMDITQVISLGSSPHARGALPGQLRYEVDCGIIPACAGSTCPSRSRTKPARDHPRMRGEHVLAKLFENLHEGSSPHARGAPGRRILDVQELGIIPACAGSTLDWNLYIDIARDHPRMRGEHVIAVAAAAVTEGSSPHARGAQEVVAKENPIPGIIPACAGSTWARPPTRPWPGDHPRMRGEHAFRYGFLYESEGSSPHARGARLCNHRPNCLRGIIPACAGSTDKR